MSVAFKGLHFALDIILLCMRWYCRYASSYRDLKAMMAERHLSVDHTTIYRWVQHYAPELERRVKWFKLNRAGFRGGSNFQVGWSHDEQNDEQVFA